MAVVQISRIQVRRGKKGVDNLPQLASGELGWAIDTQEIYVGNGSVSEGAPAVGNTKVLTEHDNIFQLAGQYTYRNNSGVSTGVSSTQPVQRSLQQRLDDVVTGLDFGMIGDGVTDDTIAFQRAIDQLFINTNKANPSSRVTLMLTPGNYVLTATIKVPPYANIVGAGKDRTIITTSATEGFTFVNGESTPGAYAAVSTNSFINQAKHINIQGMTLTQSVAGVMFDVHSVRDSNFADLKVTGSWLSGGALVAGQKAFSIVGDSAAVMSNNNTFDNVAVSGYTYAFYSDFAIKDTLIRNGDFNTNAYGIVLGENTVLGGLGQDTGPQNTRISNSSFDEIARNAIWVKEGSDTASNNNTFNSVGNNNGTEASSAYAVIKFDKPNNTSNNDFFKRFEALSFEQQYIVNQKFTPVIEGSCQFDMNGTSELEVVFQSIANRYFRLPGDANTNYEIDYVYHSTAYEAHRSGILYISLDYDNDNITVRDEYNFAGSSGLVTNFELTASLVDENADATKDTVEIKVSNATATDAGTFKFHVRSKR
ncbi:glycosyl hydrolase family 28-related protein [bacterium]|jgi:hypothetical protein|nr:hypothetical protein [bacterium]MDC1007364.1 glycosyl hydrolase family 28-related protein [bacterium]